MPTGFVQGDFDANTGALIGLRNEDAARSVRPVSTTVAVAASRALTAADNGATLEVTAAAVTLTVPVGLPSLFGCAILPNGTTSIASSGGALLNGGTGTLTRAQAANATFAIIGRASAADSYVVSGS